MDKIEWLRLRKRVVEAGRARSGEVLLVIVAAMFALWLFFGG